MMSGARPPAWLLTVRFLHRRGPRPSPRSLPRRWWAGTPHVPVLGSPAPPWPVAGRQKGGSGAWQCLCRAVPTCSCPRGAAGVPYGRARCRLVPGRCQHGEGWHFFAPQKLSGLRSPAGTSPAGPHSPWVANWVGRVALPGIPVPAGPFGPPSLCTLRSPIVDGGESPLQGLQPLP